MACPTHHLLLLLYQWCHETPLVQMQLTFGPVNSASLDKIVNQSQQVSHCLHNIVISGGRARSWRKMSTSNPTHRKESMVIAIPSRLEVGVA